jgi:hypothetical protein
MIMSRIFQRLTINSSKMNIKLHGSLNHPMISKRSLIEKILNVLFLRQKKKPSAVENTILRKYLRGPKSDIRI